MGCLSSPFLRTPSLPPFAAHSSNTEPTVGSEIQNRASVSLFPFQPLSRFRLPLIPSMRCRARRAVSRTSEASSKRQDDGQRFQKKVMKTTKSKSEASAPANVRPSSVSKSTAKEIALAAHCANRQLATEKVLELLRSKFPRQYELAEIVGRWIWLDVPAKSRPAAKLWTLGFHWNKRRALWQHPCGAFAPFSVHTGDPRRKYGSRFAADIKPA